MPNRITGEKNLIWPNGAKAAVMLTFDFDAETLQESRFKGKVGFADRSRGQYGPTEGLKRCLEVLDRRNVKGTFFVPGVVAERYPEHVKRIAEASHEIACHGYAHETELGIPREAEAEILKKAEQALKNITGKTPVGHRAPSSIMQMYEPELLYERGYLYSSSMKTCDWAYCHEINGKKVPLVELPVDYCLDDFSYFYFTLAVPRHKNIYRTSYVREIWQDEFDGLAAEGNKIMCLKLHPQLIGRASRAKMLESLIEYMQDNGAWIATCEETARYVLDFYGFDKEVRV